MQLKEYQRNEVDWKSGTNDNQEKKLKTAKSFLYKMLGLSQGFIQDKDIIEIGCSDALVGELMMDWDCSSFTGVEGLEKSADLARARLSKHNGQSVYEIICDDAWSHRFPSQFDLLIYEGGDSVHSNLESMVSLCKANGYILLGNNCAESMVAELSRRLLVVAAEISADRQNLHDLVRLFEPELEFLTGMGMTKTHELWVQDHIVCKLHDQFITRPRDLIRDPRFEVMGLYPTPFPLLQWYKEVYSIDKQREYWLDGWMHFGWNLIDSRIKQPERLERQTALSVKASCNGICDAAIRIFDSSGTQQEELLARSATDFLALSDLLSDAAPETAKACGKMSLILKGQADFQCRDVQWIGRSQYFLLLRRIS